MQHEEEKLEQDETSLACFMLYKRFPIQPSSEIRTEQIKFVKDLHMHLNTSLKLRIS